jgi:hypothetical protein
VQRPPASPTTCRAGLEAWTGERWIVSIASVAAGPTLADQKREQRDSLFRHVRQNPDVQTILSSFPGAEIVEVRDLAALEPATQSDGTVEPDGSAAPDTIDFED